MGRYQQDKVSFFYIFILLIFNKIKYFSFFGILETNEDDLEEPDFEYQPNRYGIMSKRSNT